MLECPILYRSGVSSQVPTCTEFYVRLLSSTVFPADANLQNVMLYSLNDTAHQERGCLAVSSDHGLVFMELNGYNGGKGKRPPVVDQPKMTEITALFRRFIAQA